MPRVRVSTQRYNAWGIRTVESLVTSLMVREHQLIDTVSPLRLPFNGMTVVEENDYQSLVDAARNSRRLRDYLERRPLIVVIDRSASTSGFGIFVQDFEWMSQAVAWITTWRELALRFNHMACSWQVLAEIFEFPWRHNPKSVEVGYRLATSWTDFEVDDPTLREHLLHERACQRRANAAVQQFARILQDLGPKADLQDAYDAMKASRRIVFPHGVRPVAKAGSPTRDRDLD